MKQAVLQLNSQKMVRQIVGNDLKSQTKILPSGQVDYAMSCYETIVNGVDQAIEAAQNLFNNSEVLQQIAQATGGPGPQQLSSMNNN